MSHFNEKYPVPFKKQVIRYFRNHTARECAEHFGLTHGQIIGVLEMSRRKGLITPAFKDTRTKAPWSVDELLFVIRHAGIRPRAWVGKKLGRGGARVIKERLRKFNSGTKWLNGMPRKWAIELWGERHVPKGIKTDAGPTGGQRGGDFFFIIVPWTDCEKLCQRLPTDPSVKQMIQAMAKFQRWIHGVNDSRWVTRKLKGALRE